MCCTEPSVWEWYLFQKETAHGGAGESVRKVGRVASGRDSGCGFRVAIFRAVFSPTLDHSLGL